MSGCEANNSKQEPSAGCKVNGCATRQPIRHQSQFNIVSKNLHCDSSSGTGEMNDLCTGRGNKEREKINDLFDIEGSKKIPVIRGMQRQGKEII